MTRVFVADATPATRSAMRLLLTDMQMQVVGEAQDWPSALAQVPGINPDLLVVDWDLPAGIGAALAELRAACPNLRVVVLSGKVTARQAALHAGADVFISTGDAPDRVTEHLRAAAGSPRSELLPQQEAVVEMTEMTVETEVVFPRSLSDIYPEQAQKLYVEAYKQSWVTAAAGSRDNLSRESVAARDAWEAVRREYAQDPVTHKFRLNGEQAAAESIRTGKRTFLGTVKGLFRR
jgi:DNA-binding NarL/FixJ family response regulator